MTGLTNDAEVVQHETKKSSPAVAAVLTDGSCQLGDIGRSKMVIIAGSSKVDSGGIERTN